MREGEKSIDGSEVEKSHEGEEKNFEILRDKEVRELLWDRVNRLVDGVANQRFQTPVLMFLDKSARPLSWMFRARWKHRFPDRPVPRVRYAAVGRRQMLEGETDMIVLHQDLGDTLVTETSPWGGKRLREIYGAPMQIVSGADLLAQFAKEKLFEDGHGVRDEYDARVRELAGRYADLKDEKIFVVDEYSETGTSQLLTELMLQDALPNANVHGLHLFGAEEQKAIPWLQHQGLAGVVELAGQDELLASPLTRENFERVRTEMAARTEEYDRTNFTYDRETFLGRLDDFERNMRDSDAPERESFLATVGELKARCAAADRIADLVERLRAYEKIRSISSELYGRFSALQDANPALREVRFPLFWLNPSFLKSAETLAMLTSFEDVKTKSDALREELVALARLDRDQLDATSYETAR